MIRILLTLATVVLLIAAPSAQAPGGCARCGVYAYVDVPDNGVQTIPIVSGEITIAGWGFECESGAGVDRVDVWYSTDDGWFTSVRPRHVQTNTGGFRPDVASAYLGACPNVTNWSGFGAIVGAGVIPAGTRVVIVNVWRGPYRFQSRRVVIVR